ncbi:dTDP-4-dehydrorhamnose reductase [[Eubacterium] yurii]|nr:dTDP-4-dehydrorhamnose reductase [[Eubacterium] yurii]
MKKKILIIGSSGYVGRELVDFLRLKGREVVTISRTEENSNNVLDLNLDNLNFNFLESNQFILFLSAISSIEECQNNYKESYKVNVFNTKRIIKRALEMNNKVIFFSSDAVFENKEHQIIDDSCRTNPKSNYGKMKKLVEDEFKTNKNFKAIRLSYVFSKKDRFTKYYFNCLEKNDMLKVYHPFYRNIITMKQLKNAIFLLINKWDEIDSSLINFGGIESVSRIQIIDMLNYFLNENVNYEIENKDDFWINRSKIIQMKSKIFSEHLDIFNNSFYDNLMLEFNDEL